MAELIQIGNSGKGQKQTRKARGLKGVLDIGFGFSSYALIACPGISEKIQAAQQA